MDTERFPATDGRIPVGGVGLRSDRSKRIEVDPLEDGGSARPTAGAQQANAGTEGTAGAAADSRASGRRWTVTAIVLAVLAVVALGAAVKTGAQWGTALGNTADRAEAVEAARDVAVGLTTIDFQNAKANVQAVLDRSTGDFNALFGQNAEPYISLLTEGKVVSQGEVVEAAVKDFDGQVAHVLVAMKVTIKNSATPDGEERFYRMVEEMQKEDGDWLVARVDFVP